MDIPPVQPPGDAEAHGGPQQLPAVFLPVGQVGRVHVRREGIDIRKHQIRDAHQQHPGDEARHQAGLAVGLADQGIQGQHHHPGHRKGHPHVQGRVDPQVQPGEGHQQQHRHAGPPDPGPTGGPGNAAEGGHGVLGVTAGEGVARGLGPGAFHNGEVRVPDPGPGNPEQQLQKLVHHRAEKAHQQQIVPLLLADAPEDQNGRHHENGLLAQVGHGGEHRVPERGAHALQRI